MKRSMMILAVAIMTLPVWAQPEPSVVLYDDPHFRGTAESFRESDPDLRNNHIGDNQTQSIRIPRGAVVTLFEHKRYRGRAVVLTADTTNIGDTALGGGKVSSLVIEWTEPDDRNPRARNPKDRGRGHDNNRGRGHERGRGHDTAVSWNQKDHPLDNPRYADSVLIFSLSHFRGRWDAVESDMARLHDTRVGNDGISSIVVPEGYEVALFPHPRYQGEPEILRADDTDLANNDIGLNRVSSMRVSRIPVRRYGTPPKPVQPKPAPPIHQPEPPVVERPAVLLFRDAFFKGNSMPVNRDIPALGATELGNDALSSLRVPEGWEVILFEDENYRGRSMAFNRDYSNLAASRFGNDRASSLQIRRLPSGPATDYPQPDPRGFVTLFQHGDFRGEAIAIDGDIPDLSLTKLGNDALSSLRVPAGYRVILFEHENYRGLSEAFIEDVPDMDRTEIGNDQVSSIRVERIRR